MGYCFEEEKLGVLYGCKPKNAVRNILHQDSFGWLTRMKVVYELARLLEFLHNHDPSYLVLNLSAAHLLLDQDLEPKLLDYGMLLGGEYGVYKSPCDPGAPWGSFPYTDFNVSITGIWDKYCDVYGIGVILFELILQCPTEQWNGYRRGREFFHDSVARAFWRQLQKPRIRLHQLSRVRCCLKRDPDYDARDGAMITGLAVACTVRQTSSRPCMREFVKWMEKLKVIRRHYNLPDIDEKSDDLQSGAATNPQDFPEKVEPQVTDESSIKTSFSKLSTFKRIKAKMACFCGKVKVAAL